MTVIQQSSEVTDGQKQLRIVGEPKKVDYAQQLINDMLTDKETDGQKFTPRSEYGAGRQMIELPVSPQFIGLVIGKGGENIKRISQETGAKLQVDTTKTDGQGNKICQITGTNMMSLNMAADMVKQILDNAANGRFGGFTRQEELRVQVPINKTGLVIGKGGETVKALKQQCGCSIELDKNSKGIFIIRGPPERVPYAQQLISEKVQSPLTVISSTLGESPPAAQPAGYDQYWAAQSQYGYQPAHDSAKQSAESTGKHLILPVSYSGWLLEQIVQLLFVHSVSEPSNIKSHAKEPTSKHLEFKFFEFTSSENRKFFLKFFLLLFFIHFFNSKELLLLHRTRTLHGLPTMPSTTLRSNSHKWHKQFPLLLLELRLHPMVLLRLVQMVNRTMLHSGPNTIDTTEWRKRPK